MNKKWILYFLFVTCTFMVQAQSFGENSWKNLVQVNAVSNVEIISTPVAGASLLRNLNYYEL